MVFVLLVSFLAGEGVEPRLAEASALYKKGDRDGAVAIYKSVAGELKLRSDESESLVVALQGWGDCLRAEGQYKESVRTLGEARNLAFKIGAGRQVLSVNGALVDSLIRLGRLDEARKLDREMLTTVEAQSSGSTIAAARILQRLANIEHRAGNADLADERLDAAMDIAIENVERVPDLFSSLLADAGALQAQRDEMHLGAAYLAISIEFRLKRKVAYSEMLSDVMNFAAMLAHLDRLERATDLFSTALREARKQFGEKHPYVVRCRQGLAYSYARRRRPDDAEKHLDAVEGELDTAIIRCWIEVGRKKHAKAIELARPYRNGRSDGAWKIRHPLAVALTRSGKYEEAREVFAGILKDWKEPRVDVLEDYVKCLREGDIVDNEVEELLEAAQARDEQRHTAALEETHELREHLKELAEKLK